MKTGVTLCLTLFIIGAGLKGAPAPYTAVEVYPFATSSGVAFPAEDQSALAEDIAREISVAYETVVIVRPGEIAPTGRPVLRISGVVTRFKPGSRTERYLIGFGAGATVVKAQVRFTDAATGQILLRREVTGLNWTRNTDGNFQHAGDSLAGKIVKICNAAHLIASN
jgi:hypothetical protein